MNLRLCSNHPVPYLECSDSVCACAGSHCGDHASSCRSCASSLLPYSDSFLLWWRWQPPASPVSSSAFHSGSQRVLSVAAGGAALIDDCYNANPGSVRAAIDMLASCSGRRTLVLGAMLELGERSEQLHREIGAYAATAGIDQFCGVGDLLQPAVMAFGAGARWFPDCDAAIEALEGEFGNDDTVLVKGSRGARMERLLHVLQAGKPAPGN